MLYYTKSIKYSIAVLYYSIARHIDQFNRIKNPETDPHIDAHLIFEKKAPKQSKGKGNSFKQVVLEQQDIHMGGK